MNKENFELVTGAAGFIVFHVALRLLQAGERVVGMHYVSDSYDVSLKEARLRMLDDCRALIAA